MTGQSRQAKPEKRIKHFFIEIQKKKIGDKNKTDNARRAKIGLHINRQKSYEQQQKRDKKIQQRIGSGEMFSA